MGSTLKGKMRYISCKILRSNSLYKKLDLFILMLIPDVEHKVSSSTSKAIHSMIHSSHTKKNDIVYKSRWVKYKVSKILMPRILPLAFASLIRRLIPPMTKINSRGDKGQPFLIPLVAVKKHVGVPFTKIAKFTVVTHPIIQLTPPRGTPI